MSQEQSPPPKNRRVAVLGGGPAGLAAAHRLLQRDTAATPSIRVDLYEASGRFGGVVTTESRAGFRYELGPASMNVKYAAVADLIHEKLRLSPRVEPRSVKAKRFYLVRDGEMLALPVSPVQFVQSALLSWRAKLAVLAEPFVPRLERREEGHAESVGQFFERRFGKEVVDYVIDPMLAGIYSAKPAELSMKHAFASIWRLEREKGSVIGGLFRGGAKVKPDPKYKAYSGKELRASFSYDEGMEVLTSTIVSSIRERNNRGGRLYKHAKVRMLDQDPDGMWRVNGRGKYDAVISTIPTHALGSIYSNVSSLERGFRRLAKKVHYAPVSIVVLGFDKAQIPHPLDGYGALVPSKEGRLILGVNFSSSNFPKNLKDPEKVLLTVYVGGSRSPDLPFRPAREVVDVAKRELRHVLGATGDPCYTRVKTWTKGIPQYAPGYDEALCTMARVEKKAPGLVLGGNYRGGIGLPDALISGVWSAERVMAYLKTLP